MKILFEKAEFDKCFSLRFQCDSERVDQSMYEISPIFIFYDSLLVLFKGIDMQNGERGMDVQNREEESGNQRWEKNTERD